MAGKVILPVSTFEFSFLTGLFDDLETCIHLNVVTHFIDLCNLQSFGEICIQERANEKQKTGEIL